ncbi:hypothetical protein MINTM008_03750 [Mycobacterium intracellulare]|uniref:Lipoprotein n=2 Tax=Mycobacterium avium complex (MAC) TaxID=120793 RepID=A0A7R7MPC5_MYCIT|nr:hypothetical protein [Mycobacterium intracellulare]ASW98820.1 hypothetical protein CKJ58_01990 [Mycobacterium intracellulare subsp. chimaera]OSC22928.1 hypothetical protein B8W68_19985 [Mycobacterium paraintracellulare]BCP34918.1 hypothetical protein MINTMi198_02880 [Mycobacterium intracellulare M.i.198]ASW83695.1 hypothetical protein CKJ61_01475 [Mycobacterium intracellulare]ASW93541.1 hypothetical protein CKJ67_01475 [Mycobacterium intracellulare]
MISRTLAVAAGVLTAFMTSCNARADAPAFPDISGYSPVTVADYTIGLPNTGRAPLNMVYFLTPDGITCDFFSGEAQCTGNNFPAVPPASGAGTVNAIGTASGLAQSGDPIAPNGQVYGHPLKTLPPLHSITVDGIICGVDNSGTTACKDPQGRGFVLSPHGSGWLPHV